LAPFEPNEILALVFVLLAFVITAVVRAHPANTGRTRAWWSRFLVLLGILLLAELATNIEQLWAAGTVPRDTLNLVEHLALLVAAGWALCIGVNALVETHQRTAASGEVSAGGDSGSSD